MNNLKPVLGLAFNGGGARGLISIQAAKQLEKLLGGKLSDHFKYISGTSTGSIIAAGISTGRTMEEIEALYLEHLPKIFHKPFYRFGLFQPKYKDTYLNYALERDFGAKTKMSDVISTLLIPALNSDLDTTKIFKSTTSLEKLWEVVRASSSAPIYFKKYKLNSSIYEDGGISHNNPSDILFHQMVDDGIPIKNIRIINITTGAQIGQTTKKEVNGGVIANTSKTISSLLYQQDIKVRDYMTWVGREHPNLYTRLDMSIIYSSGEIDDVSKNNLNNMIIDGLVGWNDQKYKVKYLTT